MKDLNLIRFALDNEWALLPSKIADMMGLLAFHAAGHKHTPEEVQALAGDSAAAPSSKGATAILSLRGVISHRAGGMQESSGGASVERFISQFRAVMTNDAIGAVIIDVDSPGGTVAGVQEIVAEMMALRGKKPVVAVANSLMASAAYWIAAAADEIVSIPSGTVGSIGVFTAHQDLSAALEQQGVKVTLISAGKFKTEGNPFEALSDDARAIIQARVDKAYNQFASDVAAGRGVSVSDVKGGFGQGRAVSSAEAKAAGMIDRIATLDQTIVRLSTHQGRSRVGVKAEAEVPLLSADGSKANPDVPLGAITSGDADGDRARRFLL